jgi:hypothetical protein
MEATTISDDGAGLGLVSKRVCGFNVGRFGVNLRRNLGALVRVAVAVRHSYQGLEDQSDKKPMTERRAATVEPKISIAWALQMKATTLEDPARLMHVLTGAILGNGGWVLSRGASDAGVIDMLFEFERQHCVDMYTVLIAAGLELSQLAHMRFTELCQCTSSHFQDCYGQIVSVDLEVHSFSQQLAPEGKSCPPEAA